MKIGASRGGRGGRKFLRCIPQWGRPGGRCLMGTTIRRLGQPVVAPPVTRAWAAAVFVFLVMSGVSHATPQFAAPFRSFDVLPNPEYGTVADINGDGKPDFATVGNQLAVSIRLGNGDGTFGPLINAPTGLNQGAFHMAIGDLNGDG